MVDARLCPTLELRDVGVRFGTGAKSLTALSGITTPVMNGGEVIAVVGPNGAGKSTLFKRVAGLLTGPGEVIASGSAARRPPRPPCYLPQEAAVTAILTVYESILLARKQNGRGSWTVTDEDLERVDRALDDLGIEDLAFRNLSEMSGGQRQLVSIAQTLVRDPEILLMDEPTSALDLHRQMEVLELIARLAEERSICILVAIHDLNQALRVAHRVMVLATGQLVAMGEPREVITSDLLEHVYGVRARVVEGAGLGAVPYVVVEGSTREERGSTRTARDWDLPYLNVAE